MQLFEKFKSFVNIGKRYFDFVLKKTEIQHPMAEIPQVSLQPAPIDHLLNDPSTPNLIKKENAPTVPTANSFVVQGFKGGGFAQETIQFQAAQAYVTVGETINFINDNTNKKIPHWPRTSTLVVMPRAGQDLNAFYDGHALQFFYFSSPQIGGTVFTVDSADVVSHECGHSILDSYRPDLWNVAFLETGAFHECFGDFAALVHALNHDEMLQQAIHETNGDMSKSNVITRLAEQFGSAIYKLDPNGRNPAFLRNAVNSFKYVNPGTLPTDAPDNQLAAEVHSFSRIFVGAIWDLFVLFYNDAKSHGSTEIDAMKYAKNLLCKYVLKAIQNCPITARFFESMAKTILWCDVTENNRKYHDAMNSIFVSRNILSVKLGMLSAPKCLTGEKIIKTQNRLNLKLSDRLIRAQGHDDNPLYDVEVEIVSETAHFYDNQGNFVDVVHTSNEEGVKGAQDLIHYLHKAKKYGHDQTTPWDVVDGKLIRTRTCC